MVYSFCRFSNAEKRPCFHTLLCAGVLWKSGSINLHTLRCTCPLRVAKDVQRLMVDILEVRSRHAAVARKGMATRQLREQQHHLQPLVPATALASSDNSSLAAHVPGSSSEAVSDSIDDVSVFTISCDSRELVSSNVAATRSSSSEPFGPRTHRRCCLRKAQLPLFAGTNHPT